MHGNLPTIIPGSNIADFTYISFNRYCMAVYAYEFKSSDLEIYVMQTICIIYFWNYQSLLFF